jgi:ADP-heptose:LPS heptosyltransferase
VVRAGALGDVLLLRAAIASLREAGHAVSLLAPAVPAAAVSFDAAGLGPTRIAFDSPAVAAWLAGGDPAPPLSTLLECSSRALAVTREATLLAALRRHVREVVACDPLPLPGSGPAWAWYAAALAPLGVAAIAPPLETPVASEAAAAEPILRRLGPGFLALHPGSGSSRKNWPAERFARLVELHAGGRPWLLVAGPAEGGVADRLARLPGAVLARELPLRVLGAALSRAGLYIGNDSGVSHLAAAYGTPSLVLFGPTDPDVWAPWGPHVTALRAPEGRLDALEVEDVLSVADRI